MEAKGVRLEWHFRKHGLGRGNTVIQPAARPASFSPMMPRLVGRGNTTVAARSLERFIPSMGPRLVGRGNRTRPKPLPIT